MCVQAAVPLPLVLGLFASKVEGVLAANRWLYTVMAPNAELVLNDSC